MLVLTLAVFGSVHLSGDVARVLIPQSPDVSTELFLKLKKENVELESPKLDCLRLET